MNTLDILAKAEEESAEISQPFGPYEEQAIISLALDHPQFFTAVSGFLNPRMFKQLECQWVVGEILNAYEKFGTVPTRGILHDIITSKITEDDPFEEVLGLVQRKSNPREIPLVKDTLLKWAKDRQFGLLYSEEALEAYRMGNYQYLEELVMQANRIADVSDSGFGF